MPETIQDEDVHMTPRQSNEVIENKLTLLKPRLEKTSDEITQLHTALSNGEISWRALFLRARKKMATG